MYLELTANERDLVLELADARIRELRVEIRHSQRHEYRDELTRQMHAVEHLRERLQASQWDVMA